MSSYTSNPSTPPVIIRGYPKRYRRRGIHYPGFVLTTPTPDPAYADFFAPRRPVLVGRVA